MKKFLFVLLSMTCFLFACKQEENLGVDISTTAFDVKLNENNTLRADVTAELKSSSSYHIEYWETNNISTLHKTKPVIGAGVIHRTLIMLRPHTRYSCQLVYGDNFKTNIREFTTGAPPDEIGHVSIFVDDMPRKLPGYLLIYLRKSPGYIYMLDTRGIPVWYEPVPEGVLVANYEAKTNRLYMITKPVQNDFNEVYTGRIIKVMNLWGNVILEKNLSELPEMTGRKAHHECRPLPNGDVLFVTTVDKKFDLRAFGGKEDEVVTGDGFAVMDLQGNIVRQWDCFETLSPIRDSKIMGIKKDWLHANSINYDSEGNYYMTFNRSSELWKIESTTGRVLYRIGKAGTVNIPSNGFAEGMHCANPRGVDEILVLDNARDHIHGTRALMYQVCPNYKKANLMLDSEIPKQYSTPNRGNVQLVDSDMLLFGSSVKGLILFTDRSKQAKIWRILSLPHIFYRAEYIPFIDY